MGFTHGGIFLPPYCCFSNKCVALHYVLCIGKGSTVCQGFYSDVRAVRAGTRKGD